MLNQPVPTYGPMWLSSRVVSVYIHPPHVISPQRLKLETSNFVHMSAMWSLSLVMSECSLSGRGQGHASNLRKFRHSKSSVYRWYPQLVRGRFVYDTYRTMEATRSRHGLVHMFITHCHTVTHQLHNFDLSRTCRTSSFCTVAWPLARFQLTRRIARSLGDSWASCLTLRSHEKLHVRT